MFGVCMEEHTQSLNRDLNSEPTVYKTVALPIAPFRQSQTLGIEPSPLDFDKRATIVGYRTINSDRASPRLLRIQTHQNFMVNLTLPMSLWQQFLIPCEVTVWNHLL